MVGVTELSERRTTETEPRDHFHQVGAAIAILQDDGKSLEQFVGKPPRGP